MGEDIIEIEDEDGNKATYEVEAYFIYEDEEYLIVSEPESDDATILRVDGENLYTIDDEETFLAIKKYIDENEEEIFGPEDEDWDEEQVEEDDD
jgi:hypothetical protein